MRQGLWAFGLFVLVGCGEARTVPVEGVVVWSDGSGPATELNGGDIVASLAESKSSSRGTIGPDGRFRLSTFVEGDGAEPGLLKVVIAASPGPDPEHPLPSPIARKYAHEDTSGLTIQAERGRRNEVTLEVERVRPPKK